MRCWAPRFARGLANVSVSADYATRTERTDIWPSMLAAHCSQPNPSVRPAFHVVG